MSAPQGGVGPHPAGAGLTVVDETGSTNDDARSLAVAGAAAGTAVAARRQTRGRGRRGHAWSSPDGGLYLSVVLRPAVPMGFFVGLPAACSLGVLEALRDAGAAGVGLKWPNDAVLGEGKLAGVLVEAGAGAGGPYAVCGVGVNLARGAADGEPAFDGRVPAGAGARPLARAWLADALPAAAPAPSFEGLAEALRRRIVEEVDAWADSVSRGLVGPGPLAPLLGRYRAAVPMLGHLVEVFDPAGELLGRGAFEDVDAWGRALVRFADGRVVPYASEQASLRPYGA